LYLVDLIHFVDRVIKVFWAEALGILSNIIGIKPRVDGIDIMKIIFSLCLYFLFNLSIKVGFYIILVNKFFCCNWLSLMNMKITKDPKERIDINGFSVDFVFCSNCVTFISIAKSRIGDDVICIKCRTDKFIT